MPEKQISSPSLIKAFLFLGKPIVFIHKTHKLRSPVVKTMKYFSLAGMHIVNVNQTHILSPYRGHIPVPAAIGWTEKVLAWCLISSA